MTDHTVSQAGADTAAHEVVIEADDGGLRADRFVCNAPADALCHAIWSCDCEEFYDCGMRNGVPAHRPGGGESDDENVWHAGRLDPGFCNLREWYENSDEALNGSVSIPVTEEWQGDYYAFTLATSPADADTAERIAQAIEVEMRRHDLVSVGFSAVAYAYAHAARIAREHATTPPVAATSEEADRG